MTRQGVIASTLTVIGVAAAGLWSLHVERQGTNVGLVFDAIDPASNASLTEREGTPMTREELATVEAVAFQEVRAAFAFTCLDIVDADTAKYRVRVHADLVGLVAGQSRSLPGLRGSGDISFSAIAASAVAFAPPGTNRETLVEAIGHGIGRTATHELAHQLLGAFQLHDPRDRLSYEYPDLRPEHFYGTVHWSIAAAPLRARFGRGSLGCR